MESNALSSAEGQQFPDSSNSHHHLDTEIKKQPSNEPASPTLVSFEWDTAPENPHNWPLWKRIYVTSIPALMAFTVTLGSGTYAPAVPDIVAEFSSSTTVVLLGLSTWILGLGFGPVLAAPLSETFGRSSVYLISLPLSAFFTIGAGLSTNLASLIVCRFFGGFFGAPTLAVGAGSNADVWKPIDRAAAISSYVFTAFAGPAIGPIVGGFASQAKGWRWSQWPVVILDAAVWLYALPMPETHKKIILQRRAKRLNIEAPPSTGPKGAAAVKMMLTVTLFRPVWMLFTEPIVGFFSLYIAFNFSVLFCFFAAFPLVFQEVYGFGRGPAGLVWLSILVGCMLGVMTIIAIDKLVYRKYYVRALGNVQKEIVAPEYRLYSAMLGSLGLPIGLFWFGWSARKDVHWISPVLAGTPFAWGNLCVFVSYTQVSTFPTL